MATGLAVLLTVLIAVYLCLSPVGRQSVTPIQTVRGSASTNQNQSLSTAVPRVPAALELSRRQMPFASFQQHPFAAARESSEFGWTAEDGKNADVIRLLAHNELEYQRMVEENSRIFRRQLVYLKDPAAAVFERAKLTGDAVRQLTLPGLDGQELQFEIVKSEGNGSSRQGMFSGHLVGNIDSQVSLAFMDGREAFTILSPKENIYIVGEPREPGQVIVKVINPDTYGGPVGGDDAIITGSTQK